MTLLRLSKRLLAWLPLAAMLAFVSVGCSSNGCEQTRESFLCVSFQTDSKVKVQGVSAWAIDHGRLTHTPAPDTLYADSLMFSAAVVDNLEFMLQPDTTETRIRLQLSLVSADQQWQSDDTLTVRYESYPYFIDMDCGCSVFYDIKEAFVTGHQLKSVNIKNSKIKNEVALNLVIDY